MSEINAQLPRVGIFRSPARIRNFSMDGYAESLAVALRDPCSGIASIEEVRPDGGSTGGVMPVRLSNVMSRYPRYLLKAHATRLAVNHIVDQAYGHLVYVLDASRTIVTCHDIFPLKLWKGAIRGLEPRAMPPATVLLSLSGLKRARTIVTPTRATKEDLVTFLGIDPEKVRVVPYGIDAAHHEPRADERARAVEQFPLAGGAARYILTVDTGAAYKNPRATVEVLARVRAVSNADVRLVRVGPPLAERERRRALQSGVLTAIIELGPLPCKDVALLYYRSDALLFPSFYEGFGWPPLEAMACGLPVVSSRAAAVEEVVSDAALCADAEDYDALAAHMLRVLDDPATADHLIRSGRARAAAFTWDRAARDVTELYRITIKEHAA